MAGRLLTLRRQMETRRQFQTFVGCVLILRRQLETDRQLQMFLGHVLTLRRDGNVPSNICWERNELSLSAVNIPSIP